MPEFKSREEYEKWKSEKIRSNLERLQGAKREEEKTESPQAPPPPQKKPPIQKEGGLKPLEDLFSESWELFKIRFITLISLYLLSIVFLLIPLGVFAGIGFLLSMFFPENKIAMIVGGLLIGMIPGFIAMFWAYTAFMYAVIDETLVIKNALRRGWQKIWPFTWLFSILSFIVTGGFLLFLIPGIIFAVWFSFSQFIIFSEGDRGMDALLKSKEYVKGNWFDVFGRLFVIWLIYAILGMVPFIGAIVSIAFFPFMMIFLCLIYQDLRKLKGEGIVYPHSAGEKFKWIGAGALGYIILPLIIIGLLGVAATIPFFMLRGLLSSQGQ